MKNWPSLLVIAMSLINVVMAWINQRMARANVEHTKRGNEILSKLSDALDRIDGTDLSAKN